MNTRSIRFRLTVWHAGLLAGLLLFFGAAVYFGLERYLKSALEESVRQQARQIAETLLVSVHLSGEPYVAEEIVEHYDPEAHGRFVRVTRADGSVLYTSGAPEDGSFNPTGLPLLTGPAENGFSRQERLPDGNELLIYTLPYTAGGGGRYLVEVGAPYGAIENALRGLLLILSLALPVCVAIAAGGGYLLIRRALIPLGEMTRGAERITSRNLNERLPVARTGDELERLAVALNHMIARLDDAFQHISRFSADASHELRTPLTVLRGELEAVAERQPLAQEVRETLGSALEEAERLTKIVESLLAISRLDAGEARMERTRLDLAELAAATTEQMRLLAEDKDISLRYEGAAGVEVEGDRARLKQVVVNLLDNAIKYTPPGGSVRVMVRTDGDRAVLEVRDSGVGIPADALPHIFKRFYRVDKARSRQMGGTGLGLSIVKSICAAHGGRVEAQSVEGEGSRFRAEIPLANGQPDEKQ
ncbi:MAG TPA: heavy metal sensor histidine kinase [Blastocatellia bacterium]|nr:heavy metal sensor histidine kinase [Blastocatellia bacterium]